MPDDNPTLTSGIFVFNSDLVSCQRPLAPQLARLLNYLFS